MDGGSPIDGVSPFEPTVVGAVRRHWLLVLAVVAADGDIVRAATADRAKAVGAQLDASIASLDAQLRGLGSATSPVAAGQLQQLNAIRGPLTARRSQVAAEAAFPDDGIGQTLL